MTSTAKITTAAMLLLVLLAGILPSINARAELDSVFGRDDATAISTPVSGTALSQLRRLPVRGPESMDGYDADVTFGPRWSDAGTPGEVIGSRDGCDTRNDVLRRDLRGVVIKPGSNGCVVLSGTLPEPYGGQQMRWRRGPDSATAQVDHVVAKGNAYITGAQHLTAQQRTDFANDPLNLITADGALNASKSDSDAAAWLPPRAAYRCTYVARQIAVKTRYQLWVTKPERNAMEHVLSSCPREPRGDHGRAWMTPPPYGGEQR